MATLVQYRARFPEHSTTPDVTVEMYLDDANTDVLSGELGDRLERARLYYAAHCIEKDPTYGGGGSSSSGSGALQSRTVGPVSVTFATSTPSANSGAVEDEFKTTTYGQRYLQIINTSLIGWRSV